MAPGEWRKLFADVHQLGMNCPDELHIAIRLSRLTCPALLSVWSFPVPDSKLLAQGDYTRFTG